MNTLPTVRFWELASGDFFRGRTVLAVEGVVGLAHNPVAVIYLSKDDVRPARVFAAGAENIQHCDQVMLRAKDWIRSHGLREGDPVDLHRMRSEVMSAVMS